MAVQGAVCCCVACRGLARVKDGRRRRRLQAPGTPSTPGTPAKPIPADLKDKIRDLLKTAKDGAIKAGDFTREYEKKYGEGARPPVSSPCGDVPNQSTIDIR